VLGRFVCAKRRDIGGNTHGDEREAVIAILTTFAYQGETRRVTP